MHPDERSARPTDARYRATSNVPSPDPRLDSGTSPSRSQAQVATRRIVYAVLISLGALLLLIGVDLMIPQFSILGLLILLGVIIPHRMRARARKRRARSAKLRASAPPPATAYTQPASRPVVAHPPPLSDTHDAIIRETHRTSGSTDGQRPPALPPRTVAPPCPSRVEIVDVIRENQSTAESTRPPTASYCARRRMPLIRAMNYLTHRSSARPSGPE